MGRSQRLGSRLERYYIMLRHGDTTQELQVQPYEWERYRVGQRLALRPDPQAGRPIIHPPDSLAVCRRWHAADGPAPPDSIGCSPRAAAPDPAGR